MSTDTNPFVGLRPFERGDSLYYFGRDQQVRSLLESLDRSRFLAVVGSSGCGKSSLVRAGLVPALEAGFLVRERDRWRIAMMKPGQEPVCNLARALLGSIVPTVSEAELEALTDELLEEGTDVALDRMEGRLGSGDTNLLLIVDQFEELFRFGPGGGDPASRAARGPSSPCCCAWRSRPGYRSTSVSPCARISSATATLSTGCPRPSTGASSWSPA